MANLTNLNLITETSSVKVYKTADRSTSIQVILVDNISGVIAIVDISDDYNIFNFITTSDYCFNNRHFYEKALEQTILELKSKKEDR